LAGRGRPIGAEISPSKIEKLQLLAEDEDPSSRSL
jgi:hypothetical protein